MAQSTISQPLPNTKNWILFYGFCCFVLLGFFPILVILSLFYVTFDWLAVTNPISKLTAFLAINYLVFGFYILFVKFKEYWEESFIFLQRVKYYAKPSQQLITFKILIPANYKYNPRFLPKFFSCIRNLFKAVNTSKQIQYNYGRWFCDLVFDFVVYQGQVTSFLTIPRKKCVETVEMFKRFFPDIQIQVVEDIYKNWPKNWQEGASIDGFTELIGFNLGNTHSNIYPAPFSFTMSVTQMPMDLLLQAIKNSFPNQKVILQQIFRFDPNNSVAGSNINNQQYEQYRQNLFGKYSPVNSKGYKDSDGFGALFPRTISTALESMAQHMEGANVGYVYRIVCLCKDKKQADIVFEQLERMIRIYCSSIGELFASNYLGIMYLTSNRQEYNSTNLAPPNFQMLFDSYVFPNQFGHKIEAIIAPIYQKYYYKKENQYRTKLIYSSLIHRDYNGQWNGDWNIASALNLSAFWQLPTSYTK